MKRSGFKKKTFAEVKQKYLKKQSVKREYDRLESEHRTKRSTIKSKARKTQKSPSVRILKKKLWNEVKRLTRERFPPVCYTCGVTVEGQNDHAGHGKAMASLPLRFKYDIRNIRRQCMICNVHRGGMTDIFIMKLEREPEGLTFLNEACYVDVENNVWRIRQDIPSIGGKDATLFIQKLLEQYQNTHY